MGFDLVELMESELSTIDDGGKIACDSFVNFEYLGLLICALVGLLVCDLLLVGLSVCDLSFVGLSVGGLSTINKDC